MQYSLIVMLCLAVLVICNYDILIDRRISSSILREYRFLLWFIVAYYLCDCLWGFLWHFNLRIPLYIDTVFFFFLIGASVFFFTKFTVDFLDYKGVIKNILLSLGILYFISMGVVTIVNIFFPILFKLEENCDFVPLGGRSSLYGIHIILLFITSLYSFVGMFKAPKNEKKRYSTVCLFGIVMIVSITIQLYKYLFPLYTTGYLVGICMLRKFIIEEETEKYKNTIIESRKRERKQLEELEDAWNLAYRDALTGLGNKLAYFKEEEKYDRLIGLNKLEKLSVAVFDINNLKKVNDTLGHTAGDEYILEASKLIKNIFSNGEIFRIGGDEFVALLTGNDCDIIDNLVVEFNQTIENNIKNNRVTISIGLANYIKGEDNSFGHIVDRADFLMYERKKEIKLLLRQYS